MGLENKLKEIRMREHLMKQKEFSKMLGYKNSSYFGWESGANKPSVEVALDIAKKLNKKVEEIWYLD